jgi:hypothetical protein
MITATGFPSGDLKLRILLASNPHTLSNPKENSP